MSDIQTLFDFDGDTYNEIFDRDRLSSCLQRVEWLMTHPRGSWWTLSELASAAVASESGVSARIRDLRKEKFGGYEVASRRLDGGIWQYRITTAEGTRH